MIDAILQRIVGVLVEKELTVPDSYPLTENSLLVGCNQKSNRDPEMAVTATDLHPALLALREDGWIVRVEGGGRVVRYRHKVMERLNIDKAQMIVMVELLLRGPQAPGALKPRIARMGLDLEPTQIEGVLAALAAHQPVPLVERLPRRPRERDHRFGHLLGPRPESTHGDPDDGDEPASPAVAAPRSGDALEERVARLESELAELQRAVEALRFAIGR
ncbi:MAG: DUF480 domain-containing protein [Planctomycetes bacterium]|nr:DUF480 domain-containing protein [Planctomycetota bacterium]